MGFLKVLPAQSSIVLLVGCLLLTAAAARADVTSPAAAAASPFAREFIIGNVGFIVLHEFGHAVIREFNVPLLGLEEDSADTIAAMTMLEVDRARPNEKEPLTELLMMAALGNALIWGTGAERSSKEIVMWAQHSLSIRRFARVICLTYGSDTARFQWVADAAKMPDIRADVCEDEYQVARHATDWLLKTYGAKVAAPHGRITVKYEEPRMPAQKAARDFLAQSQVLERAAIFVDTHFDFPKPFELRVKSCASPNAYWDPDAHELLFCYEMVDALSRMSDNPDIEKLGRAFGERQH